MRPSATGFQLGTVTVLGGEHRKAIQKLNELFTDIIRAVIGSFVVAASNYLHQAPCTQKKKEIAGNPQSTRILSSLRTFTAPLPRHCTGDCPSMT